MKFNKLTIIFYHFQAVMITSLCKKCLHIFLICLGLYKKKTISHGLFSYRPYKWRQCSKIFIETSETVSGSTWVLNISTSFPCSIRIKRPWKTVVDLLNTFTKWWIRILKQVCNSGQSNPTQPLLPFCEYTPRTRQPWMYIPPGGRSSNS